MDKAENRLRQRAIAQGYRLHKKRKTNLYYFTDIYGDYVNLPRWGRKLISFAEAEEQVSEFHFKHKQEMKERGDVKWKI